MLHNAFKQSQVLRLVLDYCGAHGHSSSSCSSSPSSQLLACWTALNRQPSTTVPAHQTSSQASRGLHSSTTHPESSSASSVLDGSHHGRPTASCCSYDNSSACGHQLAASQQHRRWKHTAMQPAWNSSSSYGSSQTTHQQQMAPRFTVFQLHQELAGGRYKLLQRIGTLPSPISGRRATLWRGWDQLHNRHVDLKCLEAGDAGSYSAGMREAALHAALGHCRNLSPMLDAFEHRSSSGRHPVMVFEQTGDTLESVTARYSNLFTQSENEGHPYMEIMAKSMDRWSGICDDPNTLKSLALDLLTGLNYLHKRGVVHMAVEPANVVLDWQFKSIRELGPLETSYNDAKQTDRLKSKLWWAREIFGDKERENKILQELTQRWEKAMVLQTSQEKIRTELDLSQATFKLRGLSQAVCSNGNMPYLIGQSSDQARQVLLKPPKLFTADGSAVPPNLSYQPPEETFGMGYIAPSYDMWKLGCLLFEAATGKKLFNADLRQLHLKYRKNDHGYNDQHYILACMVRTLGLFPREYARYAAHRKEYFYQSRDYADANTDTLKIQVALSGMLDISPSITPLEQQLQDKTLFDQFSAHPDTVVQSRQFAEFLSKMLRWEPSSRASAAELLQHDWLKPVPVMKILDMNLLTASS